MKSNKILLGVLGGLGPMSTFYFCELLTQHTQAVSDADHIDMLISSRATTPDRTAFILGKSDLDPLPVMLEEANRLVASGANLLVIPCNTAHYFYKGLSEQVTVPMLNIIKETVLHIKNLGGSSFGLLATEGTVASRAYEKVCLQHGLTCLLPSEEQQKKISSIIYDQIKQNRPADLSVFLEIAEDLQDRGAERLVLGCTELSLLKHQLPATMPFLDSLEVLAYQTIRACHKKPIGFSKDFEAGGCV
ncbi:MAG: aspartate/glutamate racemase family protein [Clostridia bacterium]|nr:aspartate/glutamate racemase family protein [Clostridia bacterium]